MTRRIGSTPGSQKGLIISTLEGLRMLHRGSDAEFRVKIHLLDREALEGENVPDSLSRGMI